MKLVPCIPCAICGSTPLIRVRTSVRNLERLDGPRFKCCHEYSIHCNTDRCPYKRLPFSSDDLYGDEDEAIKRLAEMWNEEMKYTLKLIEENKYGY